ncbi:type II toxin-antitoxin system antitoxin SocA domain-containing protein [Petrimonas sp.]|uniref:type II toxin-antitoxin system antitoxin SocA domain-containing protein n=1 Tax=Petrimonas sp. TaxID=2023866 RepID=UPI003F5111F8
MKSPFTNKEMSVVKEWRTMSFRKEEFQVLFHSYKCEDTGEQFEDELFAQLNYNQVVNQYREKYNIPFPDQIISIREKYNLSAAKMSEILGFGTNGYRQYEAGEVPSQSNAKLIRLADDPHEFKKLADYCSTLDQKIIDKIHRTVENLLEEQKKNKLDKQLENYFFGTCFPNALTGFKTPDLKKFTEMVMFFTEKLQPWKTKLNKLLFYADFMMYRQSGFSISGVQYRAIPMGPVPNNFNGIFEYLANRDDVDIYYSNFPDGGIGEQFKPNSSKVFNKDLFSDSELQILHSVAEKFKNTSTNKIIEISHKEKAWIENNDGKKLIDYRYGFELN